MKKNLWWIRTIICLVSVLMVLPVSGKAQTHEAVESITFSGGTQNSVVTYGIHAALGQAGRIYFDDWGHFSLSVSSAATTAPTKYPPPFSVEAWNLIMQGTWNEKESTGTFTLTSTIISNRSSRSDLADPMGNDEWYYRTTDHYDDTVSASGTITRDTNTLIFIMNVVVNRLGESKLVNVIVNEGQTTIGDHPTITDKSGSFTESATYRFKISEAAKATDTPEPTMTPTLEPTETPTPTETATPVPTDTPQPTATKASCPRLSPDDKKEEIFYRYRQEIPFGIANSGAQNNLYAPFSAEYEQYKCGGYQGKVLKLLNNIKYNSDPCVRAWLDDWDYGPIQAAWGGHQAVVIYPTGTDWLTTGLVLDPWVAQMPQVYTILEWRLFFGPHGIGSSDTYAENNPDYPIFGGDYIYEGGVTLSGAERIFMRTLSSTDKDKVRDMDPVDLKAWVVERMRGQAQNATLSVNSPLDVYMTDDAGHFTGFKNGNFINDLPDVFFRRFLRTDGHYWTEVDYPADRNYRVVMFGTDDGQARVFSSIPKYDTVGMVYQYDFSVSAGEFYQSETSQIGASLVYAQSRIEPTIALTADQAWIESQPGLVEPEQYNENVSSSSSFSLPWIFIGAVGLLFYGLSFAILLAGFIMKNKKISVLGLVLIGITISITLVALAIYAGSQWMTFTS